ncbi:MAG TPA: tRNA lysidine(34) synthetase TilS, partial [Hyphomonas sp.]|nr:tRNA lysidine(34) synthetase TilS [Hyphomonas sp.]
GMQPRAVSPVWPEGQGVMIARPVLSHSRSELRTCLTSRGILWVDDPSNRNLAYERVRVRAQLDGHADLKARIL